MLKIGHRGAKGHAQENSLEALHKAISLGVDMVEIDIRRCKTGELVLYHDRNLRKVAGWLDSVKRRTLEELKEVDLDNGEKILTFSEALDYLSNLGPKMKLKIDLKKGVAAERVVHTIRNYVKHNKWKYDDFLLCSFNRQVLKRIRRMDSNVNIGLFLYRKPIQFARFAKKISAYSVSINKRVINRAAVDRAHSIGLKVFAYTANKDWEIDYLRSLGVDGIVSDYPDMI